MTTARAALEVSVAAGQRELEAYAHLVCGHAELALGRLDAAQAAYERSRTMLVELHMRSQQVLDPVAGLARVALARGRPADARVHAEQILDHLQTGGSLDGTEEPLRIPLTCWRVLDALRDARADQVLASAHADLMAKAGRIRQSVAREAFLRQVPHNRDIAAAWAALQATSARPA
jgi:hypothetical protein